MRSSRRQSRSRQRRTGLAPLELVLSLPLMLFVMALMIVFGTAGAWKIRAMANSRQAGWRALEGRTGSGDANPLGWPASAEMSRLSGRPAVVSGDPFAAFPVVRGPALVDDQTGSMIAVQSDVLDFPSGTIEGFAHIERKWPLFQKMEPGRIDFSRFNALLGGTRWQHWSMGIPNTWRRILTIYDLLIETRASQEVQRYTQAALDIYYNPRKPDLTPIDGGDPEIRQLLGIITPNRHPSAGGGCTLDPNEVYQNNVRPLIRQIDLLPTRLADAYISYYQTRIRIEQAKMNPDQGLIQQLQDKIDQLNRFKATVPPPRP